MLAVVIPLLILLLSLKYSAYDLSFQQKEFSKLGIYDSYGKDFADGLSSNLIGFYKGNEPLNESYYTDKEIIHLNDIKKINTNLSFILYALLLLAIVSVMILKEKSFKPILIGVSSLVLLIILLSFINFDFLFLKIHEMSFSNDYWLLNPAESILVNVYPYKFFQDIATKIALTSVFTSAILILLSITSVKLLRRFKNKGL